MCDIDGMTVQDAEEKIQMLSKDFFLEDMMHTQMRHLSKGTLQKVGVIQALLTKPDVLLLDKPLSGQDLDSQNVFIDKINELRRENVTVLMSYHEPDLPLKISDIVYRISEGKIYQEKIVERHVIKKYILLFHGTRNTFVPENYRIYVTGNIPDCGAVIPEDICSSFIVDMIQQGWTLRRMTDEKC